MSERRWGVRKTPVERTWPTETAFTGRITARVPLPIRDRLRRYADEHNQTTTECVVKAIDEFLEERGY